MAIAALEDPRLLNGHDTYINSATRQPVTPTQMQAALKEFGVFVRHFYDHEIGLFTMTRQDYSILPVTLVRAWQAYTSTRRGYDKE